MCTEIQDHLCVHCVLRIIFVYGKLIYNLYGAKTEEAFVRTWGMGLAIENAAQFRARPKP